MSNLCVNLYLTALDINCPLDEVSASISPLLSFAMQSTNFFKQSIEI
jgi:hypothetical protein